MTPADLARCDAVEALIRRNTAARRAESEASRPRWHVRWATGRDTAAVLDIDAASFDPPMAGPEEWLALMRQHAVVGMVAECPRTGRVVGHMAYRRTAGRITLLTLAVAPDFRRQGVGMALVGKLKSNLSPHRRPTLAVTVRESNVAAQLFFRAAGLRAVEVLREHFGDDDGYRMECHA